MKTVILLAVGGGAFYGIFMYKDKNGLTLYKKLTTPKVVPPPDKKAADTNTPPVKEAINTVKIMEQKIIDNTASANGCNCLSNIEREYGAAGIIVKRNSPSQMTQAGCEGQGGSWLSHSNGNPYCKHNLVA